MPADPAGHAAAPRTWVPLPACTPECLRTTGPRPDGSPGADPPGRQDAPHRGRPAARVPAARAAARLVGLLAVLLAAAAGLVLLRGRAREGWRRRCGRAALSAAGIRLRTAGGVRLAQGGALVVANHLSWIDVLALDALGPVRMLAKREVADWPVIGPLAVRAGALFVDRAGLRALPGTVAATAAALRGGARVGVFPEGTTWCGAAAGPFRPAAFQAALDAGAPVHPVAFVLRLPDGTPTRVGAFVGEQTLWDSVRRVVRLPGLVCEATLLPALGPQPDRRALAAAAADAIGRATGVPHAAPPPPVIAPAVSLPDLPVPAAA